MTKRFSLVNELDMPHSMPTEISGTFSELYSHMKEFDYKEFTNLLFDRFYCNNNVTILWEADNFVISLADLINIEYEIKIDDNKFELSLISCSNIKYFKTNKLPLFYNLVIDDIDLEILSTDNSINEIIDVSVINNITDYDKDICNIVFSNSTFTGDVNNMLKEFVNILKTHYLSEYELKFTDPYISTERFKIKLQVFDIDWKVLAEYNIYYDYEDNVLSCRLTNNTFAFTRPMVSNLKIKKRNIEIWSGQKWQTH